MAFSQMLHHIMIKRTPIVPRSKTQPCKFQKKKTKIHLKLGIQIYQILTNDNKVGIPSLSSILLKVRYPQKNIGIISIAQKMCFVLSYALYFEFSRPGTLQCS